MARTIKHKSLKIRKYIGLSFLILIALFLWQLYRAPIALPFLKPYIIKALNHDDANFLVTLDSVNLELVRSIKPIKIIAQNVEYKNTSNAFNIKAPRVSVSFSMKALLNGVIAPSSIEIMSPNIYIFKTYGIKKEENKPISADLINEKKIASHITGFQNFMERFNSKEKIYSESYINSIHISDASLEYHEIELGKTFEFTDMNYAFARNYKDMTMTFSTLLDGRTPIGLNFEYRPTSNKLAAEIFAKDFVPYDFLGTTFGANINAPLSGKIQTLIDIEKIITHKDNVITAVEEAVTKIIFEFEGKKGNVTFEGLKDYQYNVSSVLLKGDIQGGLDKLEIKDAIFDADDQKIAISFSASGMKKLLLHNSTENIKLSIGAKTHSLPFDRLTQLWPKYISPEGWTWCNESLIGGLAKNVDFTFDFAYDKDKKNIAFQQLKGNVDVFDTSVYYLEGMPWINNVYGVASFNNDEIKIDIEKGISQGVSLNGGYVRLYDLAAYDPRIDILLKAGGSLQDTLKLIANKPLELTQEFGINPDVVKGYGDVELGLKFLLEDDIKIENIDVSLQATAEDVFIPDVLKDHDFSAPTLRLTLSGSQMQIIGDGHLDEVPVNLTWTEKFSNSDVKSSYVLGFYLTEALKKKIGIDFAILSDPYISGTPYINANINVLKNGEADVDINANLNQSALDFAFLGIIKDKGTPGTIKTVLHIKDEKITKNPEFSFTKPEFDLNGSLSFDAQNRLTNIKIPKIIGNKTDAKAIINVDYSNKKPFYNIKILGNSYNLIDFFKKGDEIDYKTKAKDQTDTPQSDDDDWLEDTRDAEIFISVKSLWTINDFPINKFTGSAIMKNGVGINNLHMVGYFDKAQRSQIKLDYEPRENGEFFLDIDSTNAGATLKVLGLYDDMKDGILRIQAKRDANKKLIGHAKMRNVSLHNTPVLARLLSVASLSGLVNMLTGDGIEFSHIDAPFEYKNKILKTNGAKASGNVMIITANGDYNRKSDDININGVIAPLRGIDKLIGSIPVIGSLLTGKDGTIFAANYTISGTAKDAVVDINPFSALSPSSLKDLIGVSND